MIPVPSGVRVWIAAGYTDMRCGMNSLALRIQQALQCGATIKERHSVNQDETAPGWADEGRA